MAMSRPLSASSGGPSRGGGISRDRGGSPPAAPSSGGSSGGGGISSERAGSPISLMPPSIPAGESKNRSLAGPESTEKAWGTSLGPKRNEPGRALIVPAPPD